MSPGEVIETTDGGVWGVSLRCAPGRASRAVGNETTVANGAEPPARQVFLRLPGIRAGAPVSRPFGRESLTRRQRFRTPPRPAAPGGVLQDAVKPGSHCGQPSAVVMRRNAPQPRSPPLGRFRSRRPYRGEMPAARLSTLAYPSVSAAVSSPGPKPVDTPDPPDPPTSAVSGCIRRPRYPRWRQADARRRASSTAWIRGIFPEPRLMPSSTRLRRNRPRPPISRRTHSLVSKEERAWGVHFQKN